MESSEIDLSEFQEENRDDSMGGGDGPDSRNGDDDQGGSTTEPKADGTKGEVSCTHFTLQ